MKTAPLFSQRQREVLARLVGWIIPASEKYGIPGADDEEILQTILDKCANHKGLVAQGLDGFDGFAQARGGKWEDWDSAELEASLKEFEVEQASFVALVTMIAAQAYYQDARVLRSLDLEARPPFPGGYEVPQGDWSLLDPVKERGKRYRDV